MGERRLVAFTPRSMQLEEFPFVAAPAAGQVAVEVVTSAVSAGTEVANYLGQTTYRSVAQPDWRADPYYPGYSIAGVVRAVGPNVTGLAVGDRVCGRGPHASVAMANAADCVRIPDGVTFDDAAMTTLCCIVLNAVRLARLELGDRVAVLGGGLIGQLALQLVRLNGGRPVVGLEPIAARRTMALTCGATAAIDPTSADAEEQLAALAPGGRFDVVFEATGSPAAINPALQRAARAGRVVLLGSTRGLVEQFDPYRDVHVPGVTVIGAHMGTTPEHETQYTRWTFVNNRRLALDLLADGSLRLAPLVSHRVAPAAAPDTYARLATGREQFLGVLIAWR